VFNYSFAMMKQTLLTLMLACLSVAAVAQSAFGGNATLTLETETAGVSAVWETEEHSFGTIPKDVPAMFTFKVVNEGTKPLELVKVKPACGCTAIDYTKEPIAPGESGYIKASYNAHNLGYFSKTITVTTNDEESPNTLLRFTGEVEDGAGQ
jgi:hypothetical protein